METDIPADKSSLLLHEEIIQVEEQSVEFGLPPSHSDFDRTKLTKDEFIELLLNEIKELKDSLNSEKEAVRVLRQQLRKPILSVSTDETSRTGLPMPEPGDLQKLDEGIPQRSARRRLDKKNKEEPKITKSPPRRESTTSITSNGPIDISDGVPLSSTFRTELTAALGITELSDESTLVTSEVIDDGLSSDATPDHLISNSGRNSSLSTESANQVQKLSAGVENDYFGQPPAKANNEDSTRKGSPPSLSSYRSRIKLPSTLKQSDGKNSSSESRPSNGDVFSTNKLTVGGLNLLQHDESSQNQDSRHPQTPDAFAPSQEASGRSEISGQLSEDSQSYFSSPFTDSPPHSSTTPTINSNFEMKTPKIQTIASTDSFAGSMRPSSQTPGSSFHVLSTPKAEEEEIDLFIKPDDFQTIRIKVESTITTNPKRSDERNCTFSVSDTETGKEMWRIRKTHSQLLDFDGEIRPVVEFFGLPPLPDKSAFSSTTPLKVDARRIALQDYFNTIFVMPHIPRLVLFRICRFLSLDFVNPLDDYRTGAKKEGFLIRRYKGLGTTWKVRWCQVDGPELEIYDLPGGTLLEQVRLAGSQIGRQSSDTVAEERGYRHAFLILENSRSSKLSSSLPKHFFCAESDSERDDWVAAMVEFTENDPLPSSDEQYTLQEQNHYLAKALNMRDDLEASHWNTTCLSSNFASLPVDPEMNVTISEDTTKDVKKQRKKSRFPFMNRASFHSESSTQQDHQSISSSPLPEVLMQVYLDQMKLTDEPAKVVFGRDIEESFALSNHDFNGYQIPSVCFRCLDFLIKTGAVYEEGIFRLSGSASSIRQLKDKFNSSYDLDLFESPLRPDIHTVAGLLKTYLRELPNPIFGRQAYSQLQNLVSRNGGCTNASTVLMMRGFLREPQNINRIHYDFCYSIFGFLRSVIGKSSTNKMSLKNLCIVFVPTLNISIDVLSACLTDFDCIFGNAEPIPDEERQTLDLHIPTF